MSIRYPKLYNGVRLLGDGPCLDNITLIDHGAFPMIQCMARTGLQVDLDHFTKLSTLLEQDMDRISSEVQSMTGTYINLNSGDQIADLLFRQLGIKQARVKFTKSRDRESVEDEVLKAIQHDHPVIPKILEFKEYSKLLGTYVKPIPKLARRVRLNEWRMFPNFTTTRVPAGRLACKDPNLLAIPSRTERGREIRCGFIARPGYVYLTIDVSQIHVRIGAHLSGDKNLCSVYENDEDIYSDFAITAFSLKDERYYDKDKGKWIYPHVDKNEHRFPSKTCILASIYDVTAAGLLEQMPVICANCKKPAVDHDCSRFVPLWNEAKCRALINAFYRRYPGIMEQRLRDHAIIRKFAYLYCMWGRLLHCAAVRSIHPWVVATCLREGANFPYLSGEVGIVKLAMAEIMDTLITLGLLEVCKPILQVHDEVIFEVREDVAEEVGELCKSIISGVAPLRVPIKSSAATALNWGSLEK